MYRFRLSPLKMTAGLLIIVTGLLLAGIVTQYIRYVYGNETQLGFLRLFNLEGENNLPSWYSSVELLLSSGVLGIIGLQGKQERNPWAWHWLALAFVFLCLSADEAASIHEMAAPLIDRWLETTGQMGTVTSVIGTSWLLAGLPFAGIVFLMFWRFLMHLPLTTRVQFLIAGGLFITGAIGVEAVGGRYLLQNGGSHTFIYQVMVLVEEGLEMVGILAFLYASLRYMEIHRISLVVDICSDAAANMPFAITASSDRYERQTASETIAGSGSPSEVPQLLIASRHTKLNP
jgi:hypothetical protein